MQAGYEPVSTVTSNLTVLVAADVNDSSSKLTKARKSGVQILSLEEFLASVSGTAEMESSTDPVQGDLFGF